MASFLIVFLAFVSLHGKEEERALLLQIGDRSLKDKTMDVVAGQIYSARKGAPVPPAEMIREMAKSRFIYVGETHNSLPNHDIQFKVIQELHRKDENLIIGLEMLPESSQEALNKWCLGILSQEEFIREVEWYIHWNLNFAFYEKIFQIAKENKIPLYGLNVPRDLIHKIRMEGWEALSDEEKKIVPKPDLTHQEHRQLIRTIFESTDIPHQMKGKGLEMAFEGLYRAQSAWDEVMAHNADRAVRREGESMVILAGSGHLLYNLGINRRAFERDHLPSKTLICVEIPKEEKSVRVSRSVADFIWGIPEEERPAYPSIGLSLKKFKGLDNLVLESDPIDGVAKHNDFQKGDVILFVDRRQFFDINELRMYLARFRWGDEAKFRILRQGEEKDILMKFIHKEEKEEKGKKDSG